MTIPDVSPPVSPARPGGRRLPPAAVVAAVAAGLVALAVPLLARGEGAPDGTGAPVPTADPVSVGFAVDMLDHHQQALQMSLLAVDKATTTPVRSLALRMIVAQQLESGRFLQYLEERGRRQGDPDREVMGWMGMPVPRAEMPGLASPEEILALTNATGPEVDRLFLDLMIRHHEGGVHMAEHAAGHAGDGPLRGVAARMVVMQRREIADMEQLRQGLG